jgi:hypothetical protein
MDFSGFEDRYAVIAGCAGGSEVFTSNMKSFFEYASAFSGVTESAEFIW